MANRNINGDVNVEFNEASSRQGLDSGESVKTLFGKVKKWLTDLKPVAFSGSYNDLTNKPAIPPSEISETPDTTPYIYKASEHDALYDELVGGSVAWNQLIQNGNFESTSRWSGRYSTISVSNNVCTVTPSSDGTFRGLIGVDTITDTTIAGHKYLISVDVLSPVVTNIALSFEGIEPQFAYAPANAWRRCACIWTNTSSTRIRIYALLVDNVTTSQTIMYKNVYTIDLTQMFGSTIADYVYNLEQSTAGSGIAWLKSYGFITKEYYPYNAGGLISVNTSGKTVVGKNQCDKVKAGVYYTSNGNYDAALTTYSCTEKIKILPNTQYTVSVIKNSGSIGTDNGALFYDANGAYLGRYTGGYSHTDTYPFTFTTPSNATYCGIDINIQKSSIVSVQLELGSRATDYEPYTSITYPIQSTDLRGLYKLNGTKLYTDGDIYSADGIVTRKYGIVDLGTLNWNYEKIAGGRYGFIVYISSLKYAASGIPALLCNRYIAYPLNLIYVVTSTLIGVTTATNTPNLIVFDSSYTDADAFKTAMSGVYLIYELATPTTETAQPFASPQIVYRNGTEEYLDTRDVPIPVGGNRKYVDIPDWMVNEYFDDLRTSAYELTQDLDDISGELDCLTIRAALVNNEVIIQNTSDFTRELYRKYFSYTKPKFAILKLQRTSNTYCYKALLNSSSVGQGNSMDASFITVGGTYMGIYRFGWSYSGTVGTPVVSYTSLNLGS